MKSRKIVLLVVCLLVSAGIIGSSIYLYQDSQKYRPFIFDSYSVRSIQLTSKKGEFRYVTDHGKIKAITDLFSQFTAEKPKEINFEEGDTLGFPYSDSVSIWMMEDLSVRELGPTFWLFPEGIMVRSHIFYAATDERYYEKWEEIFDFERNDARFDADVPDPYKDTETVFSFDTNEIVKIEVISAYPGSAVRTIDDSKEIKEIVDKINSFRYLYTLDDIEATGGANILKLYTNEEEFMELEISNFGVCTNGIWYASPLEAYQEKEWPDIFDS